MDLSPGQSHQTSSVKKKKKKTRQACQVRDQLGFFCCRGGASYGVQVGVAQPQRCSSGSHDPSLLQNECGGQGIGSADGTNLCGFLGLGGLGFLKFDIEGMWLQGVGGLVFGSGNRSPEEDDGCVHSFWMTCSCA